MKAKCQCCTNERVLKDGRLCGACLHIAQRSDPDYEWTDKATKTAECSDCKHKRPVRKMQNKSKTKTIYICKQCTKERSK